MQYYIHKDYQGSYQTITNSTGAIVETLSFDPWGRRRNATNWSYTGIPTSFMFDRGYTGHEHLDVFGLINMNGRVFDPTTAHFLSPDNYIQDPGFTQSFNRYGYCLNNPLKYTDPNGEFWDVIIGGLVGGTLNVISNWNHIDNFWEFNEYFLVGSLAGGSAVILNNLGVEGPGIGMTSGFITGFCNTIIQGGSFDDAMDAGTKSAITGMCIGFITMWLGEVGNYFWPSITPSNANPYSDRYFVPGGFFQSSQVKGLRYYPTNNLGDFLSDYGSNLVSTSSVILTSQLLTETMPMPMDQLNFDPVWVYSRPVLDSPVGDAPIGDIFGQRRSFGSDPHIGGRLTKRIIKYVSVIFFYFIV